MYHTYTFSYAYNSLVVPQIMISLAGNSCKILHSVQHCLKLLRDYHSSHVEQTRVIVDYNSITTYRLIYKHLEHGVDISHLFNCIT